MGSTPAASSGMSISQSCAWTDSWIFVEALAKATVARPTTLRVFVILWYTCVAMTGFLRKRGVEARFALAAATAPPPTPFETSVPIRPN